MSGKNNFYITTQPELDRVVDLISERKLVALDTEFTRETTYYPILSIIQIAVKNSSNVKESFIVDCLCDLDLTRFFALVADKEIIKILHSPAQDLQIFYRQSGLLPRNIFDTQILANFCGLGFNIGYSNLVHSLFKKELNKNQQRSDWQRRPLSSGQVKYALLDVFFLEEIYEKLLTDLKKKNRFEWYLEEMKTFSEKVIQDSEENLLKKFSFRRKNPQQVSQIKNLIFWREQWARNLNIPRQHFIRDEQIENLVEKDLSEVRLGKRINKKMITEISEILAQKDELILENISLDSVQKKMLEKAKEMIAKISVEKNFREQFLVTNSDLKKIICEKNSLKKIITGWRYEMFGNELEQLLLDQ
ncbi:MAG: hypothetical protein KGP29_04705 [Proteobacteria bacterium]|nr:hypothetical protein [Pseudomonadota bacterium]